MESGKSLISEHILDEGAILYSSSLGNILIGCPPEILKTMMTKHVPMPDTIVIPGTLHKFNSSQACLEFPFYHFLFIQQGLARGKKFKVLAKKSTCEKLSNMLRVTLLGPDLKESLEVEKKLGLPLRLDQKKITQISQEIEFLAPKDKNGKSYQLEEMIEFVPFETGDKIVIYDSFKTHPEITIQRNEDDEFTLSCDKELKCQLSISQKQSPVYEINTARLTEAENSSESLFSIINLGSSEGFDPTKPANGFLIRFNQKWFLWDCPSFLREHLNQIGISFDQIDGIFISHVHEDHLDIMETVSETGKTTIYTSPEIYHCMVLKLMAILDCTYEEALEHYDYKPIYANQPFTLAGANLEVFYSSHAIPALGLRFSLESEKATHRFFISGDNLSNRMINTLSQANVFSSERLQEIESFLPKNADYDLAFVDSGGGAIHGDVEDYCDHKTKIVYMHTGKKLENLPKNHLSLKAGQKFILQK